MISTIQGFGFWWVFLEPEDKEEKTEGNKEIVVGYVMVHAIEKKILLYATAGLL
jgi:hypothetical protein